MDREEFIKKKRELKQQLFELESEYIGSNSPIPKGTKVKVTTYNGVEYGFLESYYLLSDSVCPSVLKMKKDGTPSLQHMYIPCKYKIEVCNG